MTDLSRRQILAALIVVAVVLVGTLAMILRPIFGRSEGTSRVETEKSTPSTAQKETPEYDEFISQSDDEPPSISVHVAGRVKQPGVYMLPAGSRVIDAVKAAGGALTNSDLDNINLAQKLSDGEQVYIAPIGKTEPPLRSVVNSRPTAVRSEPSRHTGQIKPSAPDAPVKLTQPGQGTVNINTADVEELQKLPGVGPGTAQRIVDYRSEHGRFSSVEELDEVQGIGSAKLAKLRPFASL